MNFIIIFQTIYNRYIFMRHVNSSWNSFFSFTKEVVYIKTLHDLNPLVRKKYIYSRINWSYMNNCSLWELGIFLKYNLMSVYTRTRV